ncbi:RNA-directed DNA polymerase from mobile element jockey [Trichonephila clavipes]|uniref:RNA-directed DNA polymerase from mobile element jockey n=1 Tax=Trichonephila clavipes TaxID=2585209 RepID=A0A8X7BI10_TRICX|nr:RNA-directed DNA polymerase from mobile element jockey [Trichonephila clavipes]
MDMSASRTDVASSVEVSDLFTLDPMSFDVMAATEYIDNCTTCAESEDLCGVLDEILFTLEDVDAEAQITPERLRLVNLVQWAALKCSRRSIRLQNAKFKKYIREVELSRRTPTAASPASQQKRPLAKRQPASPQKDVPSKKQAKSERKLPRTSTSPRHIEDSSSMEEGETSAEESSVEIDSAKSAKSVIAQSSPAAKAAANASAPGPSQKDDGFTTVGRNGKRIAPIVIDAQSNATELLTQIGNLCSNTSLQGRFENGKLRVFPTSAEEHRIIQKFVSDKKMRSHTFEMAHNKQLKVVLRGLPTDYNQEELMSELTTLGFKPNHISLLRNRKTNTNMPLFLMPGIFHHSRFCTRAPKCLKCSGGHLTSECTKSAKAPAKCANCSGPHPANFSGCPKNPINTKTTKSKAAKNVWQERAAARKQNTNQSKPSFAEVVKGSKNNSLAAKEVITKMAQMMSQWGDMLSLLQSKL